MRANCPLRCPVWTGRPILQQSAHSCAAISGAMSTKRFGYEAHKSAVHELNRRAAEAGLNWHLRSSFDTLPVAASSSVSSAKQLVRLLLAVAVSSTAPARRLLAQTTSRLPDTWPGRAAAQATADLWGQAATVLFSLWDRATSIIPGGSATALPIAAPATKLSLLPALMVFALVFAVGSVAPNTVRALQNGAPNAMQTLQNGRTHAVQALQDGRTHAMHAVQNGRTHAMQTLQNGRTHAADALQNGRTQTTQAVQNGRAQVAQAVRNGRTHAAQALRNGRAHAAHAQQSFEQVLPTISKMRRASSPPRDAKDAPKQESKFVEPTPPPTASQDSKEDPEDAPEDLDDADLPQAFRRSN